MPIYEYKCDECGYQVDYFQSMKEEPKTECPQCKGHLSRMVTKGAGLIFKGSGFYITDYKKKSTDTSKPTHSHSNGNGSNGKTSGADKVKKESPQDSKATTPAASAK